VPDDKGTGGACKKVVGGKIESRRVRCSKRDGKSQAISLWQEDPRWGMQGKHELNRISRKTPSATLNGLAKASSPKKTEEGCDGWEKKRF